MRVSMLVSLGSVLSLFAVSLHAQNAGPAGVDRPYHLHDKVQVNARGIGWMDGQIVSIADGIETGMRPPPEAPGQLSCSTPARRRCASRIW